MQFDESFKAFIPITIILIPIFLGLFYGLGTLACGKYLKYDLNSIFLFCATISFIDFLRAKMFTGFPWNLWAYSWSWFNEIIQILNPIGLFAFNLLTITLFSAFSIFFVKRFKYKSLVLVIIFIAFFSNYLYGNYVLNNNKIETKKILKKGNIFTSK